MGIICPPPPLWLVEIRLTDLKKTGGPLPASLHYIGVHTTPIFLYSHKRNKPISSCQFSCQFPISIFVCEKKYQKTQVGGIFARYFKKKFEKVKQSFFLIWLKFKIKHCTKFKYFCSVSFKGQLISEELF